MRIAAFHLLVLILLAANLAGDDAWASPRAPDPDYPPRFMLDLGVGYGWGVRGVVPEGILGYPLGDEGEETWRSGGMLEARALCRRGRVYVGPSVAVWWSPHSRPEPYDDLLHAFWLFGGLTVQRVSPPSGWAAGLSLGFSRLHQYYDSWNLDGFTVRPFLGRQFRVGRSTVLTPAVGAWFTMAFEEDLTMPSLLTLSVSVGWWGYQTEARRFREAGEPD